MWMERLLYLSLFVIAGMLGGLLQSIIPRTYIKTIVVNRETVRVEQSANLFFNNYRDCMWNMAKTTESMTKCQEVARESVK